jgi:hypothetical protein
MTPAQQSEARAIVEAVGEQEWQVYQDGSAVYELYAEMPASLVLRAKRLVEEWGRE